MREKAFYGPFGCRGSDDQPPNVWDVQSWSERWATSCGASGQAIRQSASFVHPRLSEMMLRRGDGRLTKRALSVAHST